VKLREEVGGYERVMGEMKQLKSSYSQLQDENMDLESHIVRLESEKGEALKEISNLEKIIAINGNELKRVEQHLAEVKQELAGKKDNDKALFAKIKEAEKKQRTAEAELEKEKGRQAKDRT
jgi:chromosome segregation ATPase